MAVDDLPEDVVRYLLASRYCEVDLLSDTAAQLSGGLPRGWQRVQAICDWVHRHVTFGYQYARSTRTALEVFNERVGVCRDFQHLGVTLCRRLNLPARYATGYLGDRREGLVTWWSPPYTSAGEFVRNMDVGNVDDILLEELKKLTTNQRSEIAQMPVERETKRKTNAESAGLRA